MRITSRSPVLSAAAWVLGAGAAVAIGMQALSTIGSGLSVGLTQPLLPQPGYPTAPPVGAPEETPAASSPPPTRTKPAAADVQSTTPAADIVSSRGGTAIIRCQGGRAYLLSWSPQRGYRATEVKRGPAETVEVKFKGDEHEVEVKAWCVKGRPEARVEDEDSDESDR